MLAVKKTEQTTVTPSFQLRSVTIYWKLCWSKLQVSGLSTAAFSSSFLPT